MFTWKINSVSVEHTPQPNTVVMSNFSILGNGASVTYSVNLLPATSSFTPFDQVTEAQAIAWTQEALGEDRVAAMEAEVTALENAATGPETAPLPWVAEAPVDAPAE